MTGCALAAPGHPDRHQGEDDDGDDGHDQVDRDRGALLLGLVGGLFRGRLLSAGGGSDAVASGPYATRMSGEFSPSLPMRNDVPPGSIAMVSPCSTSGTEISSTCFQLFGSYTNTDSRVRISACEPSTA